MRVTGGVQYTGYECAKIENEVLSLWVTTNVGPRVIGLELGSSGNLFAELPGMAIECPGAGEYLLRGGHRLWQAPENPGITYLPDDKPVSVSETAQGLSFVQPVESETGIEKSLQISLPDQQARVVVEHQLTNYADKPVELAAWAITQLKPGGTAILPQTSEKADRYGLLPNRQIALWPYTVTNSGHITWGDRYIFIHAGMVEGALKLGFPNPVGWIGYLREQTLFIKQADFFPEKDYYDLRSSSETYCNPSFLELETLGPRTKLEPGQSLAHQETWMIYDQVDIEISENAIQEVVAKLRL